MSESPVNIIRRADAQIVVATLRDGIRPAELTAIEQEWGPFRAKIKQELTRLGIDRRYWPQSLHWDWSKKARDLQLLESNGFVIEFEGATQGVMLTKTASYVSRIEKGLPLVYVDYLESAPWNWNIPELNQQGEYRGTGSALFAVAIRQSHQEGFQGRVGLHALPQAEKFYAGKDCRMSKLGADPHKQNLPYYELSRNEAQQHLREGGDT